MGVLNEAELAELEGLCPGGIRLDTDLSAISQWRIGGKADLIIRPSSTEEVANILKWLDNRGIKPLVIGLTSNLLFSDEGVRVPIIQIGSRMAEVRIQGEEVYAQAGVWVPGLARRLMQAGLTGMEHTCGIPGTLGGLICMNGGSQRRGIGENIISVESVSSSGNVMNRSALECDFEYRGSIYQENNEVLTSSMIHLSCEDKKKIRRDIISILSERRKKFPRKKPNCGSVFKSNPKMYSEVGPPGQAIERLGFKGLQCGDAQVSPLHANFIVNKGNAKAEDVLYLIRKIRKAVEVSTGYLMEAEVLYVDPNGTCFSADQE
ncbi:MAG: UDP-N-acetylmuramate dehydrogenase [Polycyclovorans sp.]|nr:UDP-N-acetylmuramate dehydrogenase [Polycyclovorans sp.]